VNWRIQSGWAWSRLINVTLPNTGTGVLRRRHQQQPVGYKINATVDPRTLLVGARLDFECRVTSAERRVTSDE
jgi:hypothetical protein